jgi:cytoskeletal protein RodZ
MRRKSFAIVAMLVIAATLMSSVIPSGSIEVAFAEEDNYTQDSNSEENRHSENHEDEDGDEGSDSARSNDEDDDEEDSDDNTNSRDDGEDSDDEENGDNGDSSETETEQENRQKNVCSGWAVCINVAENAEDSAGGVAAASSTEAATETPMILALPI